MKITPIVAICLGIGLLLYVGIMLMSRRNASSAKMLAAELNLAQQIEEARRRFSRSLVGRWSTAQGTFGAVLDQHWEFHPDGTGKFTDTGPFGHPQAETSFEWRQESDFVIEFRITGATYFDEESSSEVDGQDDPDEEEKWLTIQYTFISVPTDCGGVVGLVDETQIGQKFCGFHLSFSPLSFDGPIQ